MKELREKVSNTIKVVNEYIENINQKAYKNSYLLTNEVLSRNIYSNQFFHKIFFSKKPKEITFKFIFHSVIKYYKRNFSHFYWYVKKYNLYKKHYAKDLPISSDDIYLIDLFFVVDKILKEGKYKDQYFVGLKEILDELNISFIYTPTFVEGSNPSLKKMEQIFKILDKDSSHIICEFDILTKFDLFKILVFIAIYPFNVIGIKKLIDKNEIDKIFYYEIIDSLGKNLSFYAYARELFGKQLGAKITNNKKVISWYENQVQQKSFYHGLKKADKNTFIYGCKFYLYSNTMYMTEPLEKEKSILGIVPDKILVNGEAYKTKNSCIGVSLRYKNLYTFIDNKNKTYDCIVLLSYFKNTNEVIFEYLNQEIFKSLNIAFKSHPALNISIPLYSDKWSIVNDDVYELFKKTDIVISSVSGTVVEAVSVGKSVIIINDTENIPALYLTKGENEIWGNAFSKSEIKELYNHFNKYRKNNVASIYSVSSWYKMNYFKEPTKDNIIKSFDLTKGHK